MISTVWQLNDISKCKQFQNNFDLLWAPLERDGRRGGEKAFAGQSRVFPLSRGAPFPKQTLWRACHIGEANKRTFDQHKQISWGAHNYWQEGEDCQSGKWIGLPRIILFIGVYHRVEWLRSSCLRLRLWRVWRGSRALESAQPRYELKSFLL